MLNKITPTNPFNNIIANNKAESTKTLTTIENHFI